MAAHYTAHTHFTRVQHFLQACLVKSSRLRGAACALWIRAPNRNRARSITCTIHMAILRLGRRLYTRSSAETHPRWCPVPGTHPEYGRSAARFTPRTPRTSRPAPPCNWTRVSGRAHSGFFSLRCGKMPSGRAWGHSPLIRQPRRRPSRFGGGRFASPCAGYSFLLLLGSPPRP